MDERESEVSLRGRHGRQVWQERERERESLWPIGTPIGDRTDLESKFWTDKYRSGELFGIAASDVLRRTRKDSKNVSANANAPNGPVNLIVEPLRFGLSKFWSPKRTSALNGAAIYQIFFGEIKFSLSLLINQATGLDSFRYCHLL